MKKIVPFLGVTLVSLLITACDNHQSSPSQELVDTKAEVITCPANAPLFTTEIGVNTLKQWGANAYYDSPAGGAGYQDTRIGAAYFTLSSYTSDAVLLPTVSQVSRIGFDGIYDYFIGFLKKNPMMSKAPLKGGTTFSACGVGVMSGYYDFILGETGSEPEKVHARYTMQFEYLPKEQEVSVSAKDDTGSNKVITYTQHPGWYIKLQNSAALPPEHEPYPKD